MATTSKTTTKKVTTKAKAATKETDEKVLPFAWVVRNPRLTEKAAHLGSDNIYTFDVAPRANKIQIKHAIEEQYKIKPTRVNICISKPEKRMMRGHMAIVGGGEKKAMVFVKKGETINIA